MLPPVFYGQPRLVPRAQGWHSVLGAWCVVELDTSDFNNVNCANLGNFRLYPVSTKVCQS